MAVIPNRPPPAPPGPPTLSQATRSLTRMASGSAVGTSHPGPPGGPDGGPSPLVPPNQAPPSTFDGLTRTPKDPLPKSHWASLTEQAHTTDNEEDDIAEVAADDTWGWGKPKTEEPPATQAPRQWLEP